MNNERRKTIKLLMSDLEDYMNQLERHNNPEDFTTANLEDISECIQCICDDIQIERDEEEEVYDNLSERLQCSERGDKILDNINILDKCIESIEYSIECLNSNNPRLAQGFLYASVNISKGIK